METEQNTLNGGSVPLPSASFSGETTKFDAYDTVLTQETPESGAESEKDVKFPKRIKFRGRPLATIYRPSKSYPNYRVAWTTGGRRQMKGFPRYGDAKRHADELVKQLAKGSQVPMLASRQAADAMTAFKHLQSLYEATGKRFSIDEGISAFCDAVKRLGDRTLGDAVNGYLSTVAVVKRKPLAEAVAEFIAGRKHLAESKDGKRPRHSPTYESHIACWLNSFSETFPGHAVCDLTKEHLDVYVGHFKAVSPKNRNDRRAAVKMFLRWCAAKDYLPQHHRLFEATGFANETVDTTNIDYYRPAELAALLQNAQGLLRPALALCALAGLRIEECLRLDWADVWRVPGHVEVSGAKSKTRARRLVTINPALAAWLEPFHQFTGGVCDKHTKRFDVAFLRLRQALEIPSRRNGLRHAFCTYHFALRSNENLTAQQAGNSPAMIHAHYKGLATRTEAEAWFAVAPARPDNVIPMDAGQTAASQPS